jgi:hypothetical protein
MVELRLSRVSTASRVADFYNVADGFRSSCRYVVTTDHDAACSSSSASEQAAS